jgi:hypothetical protein
VSKRKIIVMKGIFYTMLIAFSLTSCSSLKMSVSDELKADHDEYTVKGRQGILIKQKLSFGNYTTTRVRRSWTKGNSSRSGFSVGNGQGEMINVISMDYVNKKQTINFNLTDGKNSSDVYCVSRFHSEDLQVGRSPNSILNIGLDLSGIGSRSSNLYYVQVYTNNDSDPWQLLLDNEATQLDSKHYIGVIAKSRTEYYTIVPVTRLEKNGKAGNTLLGASVGFELRNPDGKPVGAVSMIDKGMVFLGKTSAEERFLLANICAALLLQENIE